MNENMSFFPHIFTFIHIDTVSVCPVSKSNLITLMHIFVNFSAHCTYYLLENITQVTQSDAPVSLTHYRCSRTSF